MAAVLLIALTAAAVAPVSARPGSGDSTSLDAAFFQFEDPTPFGFLTAWFPPAFLNNGIELKAFVRSPGFRRLRERAGDLRALDAVYVRAMQMTHNNTAVSLFIACIATFDHRNVGLRIPVLDISFPLTSESEEDFRGRVANLPSRIYPDSPPAAAGDRDKLQHFFGSAFLAFAFESRGPARRIGQFVEQGEDAFIIDGALDERDLRANANGQEFGLALLENSFLMPSGFLRAQIAGAGASSADSPGCTGTW